MFYTNNTISSVETKILDLVVEQVTMERLKKETGLSDNLLKEILEKLKQMGYLMNRTMDNEQIYYCLQKQLEEDYSHYKTIETSENTTRFLLLSDTHIGSPYENLRALDLLYNYAVAKGISNFLHAGDLIQGIYLERDQPSKFLMIQEQIEHLLKSYPHDSRIFNYMLLGNHDYHSIKQEGLDISKTIFENRSDFSFLGYHYGCIRFYNDYVLLSHYKKYPFTKADQNIFEHYAGYGIVPQLVLRGHSHISRLKREEGRLIIDVPSLLNYDNLLQGAWDIQCFFSEIGTIEAIILKPLVIDSNVIVASEIKEKVLIKNKNDGEL